MCTLIKKYISLTTKSYVYTYKDVEYLAAVDIEERRSYLIPIKFLIDNSTRINLSKIMPFEIKKISKGVELSTQQKGMICELMCQQELIKRSYRVSLPLSADSPYDMIIDSGEGLKRVQVKMLQKPKGRGGAFIRLIAKTYSKTKCKVRRYSKENVDYICGVDLASRDMYFIPIEYLEDKKTSIAVSQVPQYLL